MTWVRQAHALLVGRIGPHENAEEAELYPVLNRLLGGTDPTATISRAHPEIAHQIARPGQLIDEIGTGVPDEADVTDLRSLLYGRHAIRTLHTTQEDVSYLSLADETDVAAACPHRADGHRAGRADIVTKSRAHEASKNVHGPCVVDDSSLLPLGGVAGPPPWGS